MCATAVVLPRQAWSRVRTEPSDLAAADRDALGTTARLVVWPAENLIRVLAAVDHELVTLDAQASRFRSDSEISALHAAGAGTYRVSDGLAEALDVALAAATWTGGRCDPTVGTALIGLGYDRDFAAIEPSAWAAPRAHHPVAGWRSVHLCGNDLTLPGGVLLDLGATAKGLCADRAARAAQAAAGRGGVLVSLGGDIAVAGQPPAGGWPVLVADEHRQVRVARNVAEPYRAGQATADAVVAQQVRLMRGGLATSSVTCRRWVRAGRVMHHIIDPASGLPASGPWRTVSVVARTCAEANAASTTAIVAGEDAPGWLTAAGLPARLIGHDGRITRTGGWPEADDGRVDPPVVSGLAAFRGWAAR